MALVENPSAILCSQSKTYFSCLEANSFGDVPNEDYSPLATRPDDTKRLLPHRLGRSLGGLFSIIKGYSLITDYLVVFVTLAGNENQVLFTRH